MDCYLSLQFTHCQVTASALIDEWRTINRIISLTMTMTRASTTTVRRRSTWSRWKRVTRVTTITRGRRETRTRPIRNCTMRVRRIVNRLNLGENENDFTTLLSRAFFARANTRSSDRCGHLRSVRHCSQIVGKFVVFLRSPVSRVRESRWFSSRSLLSLTFRRVLSIVHPLPIVPLHSWSPDSIQSPWDCQVRVDLA